MARLFLIAAALCRPAPAMRIGDLEFKEQSSTVEPTLHDLMQQLQSGVKLSQDDFEALVVESRALLAGMNCSDYATNMGKLLDDVSTVFADWTDCGYGNCSFTAAQGLSLPIVALAEAQFEKRCLLSVFQTQGVQDKISNILDTHLENLFAACEDISLVGLHCREVYARMVQWQHGLVPFADAAIFWDPLISTDIVNNCPEECHWCGRRHKSWIKSKEETFKFKCPLKNANQLPNSTLYTCSTPTRRMTLFWQKKTWCEVPDWKQQAVRQAKVGALLACSHYIFLPNVQDVMTKEQIEAGHRACLQMEQGIVADSNAEKDYDQFAGVRPIMATEYFLLQAVTTIGRTAGLAELIRVSKEASEDGDGTEDVDPTLNVIDVFTRGNPTMGGEAFFNDPIEGDLQFEVCEPVVQPTFGGIFNQFFRVLFFQFVLSLVWAPVRYIGYIVGYIVVAALAIVSLFFIGSGLTMLATLPQILWSSLVDQTAGAWNQLGRLFRISDFDCGAHKLAAPGMEPVCARGMYIDRTMGYPCGGSSTSTVKVKCLAEGHMVYTGSC